MPAIEPQHGIGVVGLLCWNTCRYWYYPWQIPWQNLTVSMQRIIGIKFQVCQEVICKQEGQAKARASAVLLRVPIKTGQTNWHLSIHPPSQKINCSRGRGEIAGCTFFYGLRKARAKINQGPCSAERSLTIWGEHSCWCHESKSDSPSVVKFRLVRQRQNQTEMASQNTFFSAKKNWNDVLISGFACSSKARVKSRVKTLHVLTLLLVHFWEERAPGTTRVVCWTLHKRSNARLLDFCSGSSYPCWKRWHKAPVPEKNRVFLPVQWVKVGFPPLVKFRSVRQNQNQTDIRAAKFTRNINDQWNHAGGFSMSICACLSLKMQPTTHWSVVPGAWVRNPPNADGCTPVAFWGLGFGKVKALLRKPRQHLLVGDPLNSVG